MNVFGVGPLELTLVLIIAVVVLGPERIPEVAVQMARAIRFLRGYATDATSQMRKELDELSRDYDDVRKELQQFRDLMQKDVTSLGDELAKPFTQPLTEPGGDPPPRASSTNGRGESATQAPDADVDKTRRG